MNIRDEELLKVKRALDCAAEAAVMLPVQRQNQHGGQMSPDMVVAVPVPEWEELIFRIDLIVEDLEVLT